MQTALQLMRPESTCYGLIRKSNVVVIQLNKISYVLAQRVGFKIGGHEELFTITPRMLRDEITKLLESGIPFKITTGSKIKIISDKEYKKRVSRRLYER